ncbi:MAG: DegV family protein [Clostridia bacterium]|nr:DegV family protein [Clostridia bacterium]
MADIKIVVDTSSDIPDEVLEKYDIGIISFITLFGEKQYVQRRDITNEEFLDMQESFDGIPRSSQTPYGDMYDYFKEQCEKHDIVIYFALSSAASGQFQTANLVRQEILEENPNAKFYIFDTYKYSLYISVTAAHAAEMVKAGKSAEEIIEECKQYIVSWRCYLLVDTLEYLKKGGRLSKTAAFVGNLLDIKPILTIENGLVENLGKFRGKKKLIDKLIDKIKEDEDVDFDNPEFMIVESDKKKYAEAVEKLKENFGDDVRITMHGEFSPLIATHVGRGALAIIPRIKSGFKPLPW